MKGNFLAVEEPLQGGLPRYSHRSDNTFNGPKKAIRLCIFGIILPGLLISIPLYLRYRVYDHTLYPVGMSDMRLIDNKVSTTWCQKQLVTSNTSFNAFLLPQTPLVAKEQKNVTMTRHLTLTDDMKEYWGFYLLKGSSITVSTCVRWPGASLIVIKGHRHLHECAYIGDDSSEELDELMETIAEKGINIKTNEEDSPTNNPDLLRRFNDKIQFHDEKINAGSKTYYSNGKNSNKINDDDELSAKEMKEILRQLLLKSEQLKSSGTSISDNNGVKRILLKKLKTDNVGKLSRTGKLENQLLYKDFEFNLTESLNENITEVPSKITITNTTTAETEEVISSSELLNDMRAKLLTIDALSRDKILNELKQHFSNDGENRNLTFIDKELIRIKRQLYLKTVLNNDDSENLENENLAIEEGFVPDEHASHHHILNETTLNDKSNSEFWSSFSSSEEALLNCSGLILSLPLIPNRKCVQHEDLKSAASSNTFTYVVPSNGYYFFVFNSENEVQENYIKVKFDLEKTVYDVSNSLITCNNITGQCSLPLDFFSNEKVVFELPIKNNDSLWNEDFIVISECEPRTSIYLICVISAPLIILLFAFQ